MFDRIINGFRSSTAMVIGAGGIGTEIVRLLAPVASRVVVADLSETLLDTLTNSVPGANVTTRKLDVRDGASVDALFSELRSSFSSLDYLFYTAGILMIDPFAETTHEAWRRSIDVNLNGAFYCVKAAADFMVPQRRGSILLLGSIAGTKARSGTRVNPVYNTTKAAISAMVNATAMQLRPYGVRINCISPGPTATRMMDVQPAQVHAAVRDITLDGRMNEPQEVAELALFVAGHGRFTGEDVPLGGGAGLGG